MDLRQNPEVGPTVARWWTRPGLPAVLFLAITLSVSIGSKAWREGSLLHWDSRSYQLYLTGSIVQGDLLTMEHLRVVEPSGRISYGDQNSLIHQHHTGHTVNKYPVGPAVFQAPFFLLAHAWCSLMAPERIGDGFTPPYQLAAAIASAFWASLGLWCCARYAAQWLPPWASTLAMLGVGFGTNLFYYATHGAGMAHPYAFFLVAWLMLITDAWIARPSRRRAMGFGAACGLLLITRPVDLIVLLLPHLLHTLDPERRRLLVVRMPKLMRQLPWAALVGGLVLLPQMAYWKATTGSWLYDTYGDEGFNFTAPHILDGLFSFHKGWFVYTPLMFFAALGGGLLLLRPHTRPLGKATLITLLAYSTVVFSWWCWWYGGSFGSRPMVDILALMTIPLGTLLVRLADRGIAGRTFISLLLVCTIALNLFQHWQYTEAILRWDGMTKERYFEIFGATSWEGLTPFEP